MEKRCNGEWATSFPVARPVEAPPAPGTNASPAVPVAAVAYLQFGWGGDFALVMVIYGVIQFIDGNILVPLLFSEAVNLHPVAIITAILFFGGVWGFWGIFFAIPLATLLKAVINAWPKRSDAWRLPAGEVEGSKE